jgi:hypothetical protein
MLRVNVGKPILLIVGQRLQLNQPGVRDIEALLDVQVSQARQALQMHEAGVGLSIA